MISEILGKKLGMTQVYDAQNVLVPVTVVEAGPCAVVQVKTVETAKRSGARVSGPIPLPTRIEKLSVKRSPHVDKKSMEQFETRTHKRLIDIIEPTAQTVDELKKLNLPSGVDITINV